MTGQPPLDVTPADATPRRGLRVPAAVRPLRHRDFRLLWAAMAVSLMGVGVWVVAVVWQVIALGGGPAQLSVVVGVYTIGILLSVLPAGIAADRLPQRSVMLSSLLLSSVVLLGVAALSLSGVLQLWHLAAGALVLGVSEGLFLPSYTALLPNLLPEHELLAANGLEGVLRPLAQNAAGPALAGVLVTAFSPGLAIAVDGVAFLIAALCLSRVRHRPGPRSAERAAVSVWGDLRGGFRYLVQTRWLLTTLLFAVVLVFMVIGPIEVLLPFAIRELGSDANGHALVLAAFGIGGAVGALLVSSRKLPRRYLTVMIWLWGLGSAPMALLGIVDALWMMVAAVVLVGVTSQGANVIWGTLLQRRVPDGMRGRVSSLDFFVSLILMPASIAVAGPAGALLGIPLVFALAGLVPVALSALALWLGRLKADELAHPLDH
ncbi:MFS family permease [Nakamurella flavida]|nr:MFS transporter [Nakamurella flavida]MDP9778499.1 MFS family permease [Nakamurella flavida]